MKSRGIWTVSLAFVACALGCSDEGTKETKKGTGDACAEKSECAEGMDETR